MESLKQEVQNIKIDKQENIPLIIKILENPKSPFALPGKISLKNHDCLHILLNKSLSLDEEAFVVGFCMGNDPKCKNIHIIIYKFLSQYFYPKKYRFKKHNFREYDRGFYYGKYIKSVQHYSKNPSSVIPVNQLDLYNYPGSIDEIRLRIGINLNDIDSTEYIPLASARITSSKNYRKLINSLKISGSISAIIGGSMLASKTAISSYGFILLACSSSQLLVSSIIEKDLILTIYSISVFLFVDVLGIYRWLLLK